MYIIHVIIHIRMYKVLYINMYIRIITNDFIDLLLSVSSILVERDIHTYGCIFVD